VLAKFLPLQYEIERKAQNYEILKRSYISNYWDELRTIATIILQMAIRGNKTCAVVTGTAPG